MKESPQIIIVGAVAGGASAAARARRLNEAARITLIERGPDVSFANCGLPYHIGGEIADRIKLALQTPTSLREQLAIEVLPETEVISINRQAKTVTLRSVGHASQRELRYDKLILSPGASPLNSPTCPTSCKAPSTPAHASSPAPCQWKPWASLRTNSSTASNSAA